MQPPLHHSLSRISERPGIVRWHTVQLIHTDAKSKLITPSLFDAGLYGAAITQRNRYSNREYSPDGRCVFTFLLKGEMNVKLGSQEYKMNPGDIAFAPPGILFRRWHDEPAWWIYFDFFCNSLWEPLINIGPYCRPHECPDLVFILLQHLIDLKMNCESANSDNENIQWNRSETFKTIKPRAEEYSRTLLTILQQESLLVKKKLNDPRNKLHHLVQQIRLSPHQSWRVDDVCKSISVSDRTLRRLTLQEYGMSPVQIIIQARIDEAVRMMKNTENTLESISQHVGYESVYSFSRLFTKYMGVAPGKFRRKLLSEKLEHSE